MELFKTAFLMTALMLLFIAVGGALGGTSGMLVAFLIALGMNFFSYFFSDTLVLKHYQAVPVDEAHATGLYQIVRELCAKANLPMPKIYIIPEAVPNAFATGRNPSHAAVAVTEGLLNLLNKDAKQRRDRGRASSRAKPRAPLRHPDGLYRGGICGRDRDTSEFCTAWRGESSKQAKSSDANRSSRHHAASRHDHTHGDLAGAGV